MVRRTIAPERPTADESGGEGAACDGAWGHSPHRGNGRTLQKHGESNWGGVESLRGGVGRVVR
jgi:hypothetical protein